MTNSEARMTIETRSTNAKLRERPILFSGEMVRAGLAERVKREE